MHLHRYWISNLVLARNQRAKLDYLIDFIVEAVDFFKRCETHLSREDWRYVIGCSIYLDPIKRKKPDSSVRSKTASVIQLLQIGRVTRKGHLQSFYSVTWHFWKRFGYFSSIPSATYFGRTWKFEAFRALLLRNLFNNARSLDRRVVVRCAANLNS